MWYSAYHCSEATSAFWHLKLEETRLFVQQLVETSLARKKDTTKVPHHWPCVRARNVGSFVMPRHHPGYLVHKAADPHRTLIDVFMAYYVFLCPIDAEAWRISMSMQSNFAYSVSHQLCARMCVRVMLSILRWFMSFICSYFRVASLALGQPYDCSCVSGVNPNNMGKRIIAKRLQNTTNGGHIPWNILLIFFISFGFIELVIGSSYFCPYANEPTLQKICEYIMNSPKHLITTMKHKQN